MQLILIPLIIREGQSTNSRHPQRITKKRREGKETDFTFTIL